MRSVQTGGHKKALMSAQPPTLPGSPSAPNLRQREALWEMICGRLRGLLGGALCALAALASVTVILGAATPPSRDDRALYSADELAAIYRRSPLEAPPPDPTNAVADSAPAAALGQLLFFDRGLSANGEVACASCHQPARGFSDGRAVAKGLADGTRNTPTLLNVALNHWFFWDGRADSLWSQALQPLERPREAGGDRLQIAHLVAADAALSAAYQEVFGPLPPLADTARFPAHARPDPDPQSPTARAWQAMAPSDRTAVNRVFSNLGKALEAYERKLVSGASPFDTYAEGLRAGDPQKQAALSPAAMRGLKLFVGAANCALCHTGPALSDGEFHDLGLPLLPGAEEDRGRAAGLAELRADIFNAAGPFSDDPTGTAKRRLEFLPPPPSQLGAFKTPTLRNVALTGPYMHDGRFATLPQVLEFYAQGKTASRDRLVGTRDATLNLVPRLTPAQSADLVAFLEALTGTPLPSSLTEPPPQP
jgi:cytochrome c peroxidase